MTIGLVLSGGGARASYQVGVLKAIEELWGSPRENPFRVICGTSAGAINASLLACESDRFGEAVMLLDALWRGLDSDDVHEIGVGAVISSLSSLAASFLGGGFRKNRPWSLLDNSPLRALLSRVIRFDRLADRIGAGDLYALSISALGYNSGDSLSYFAAPPEVQGWRRHRRVGVPSNLTLRHLMGSTAIPGIYPAVRIDGEYLGDGAVRQTAPLSPALHLGARKLFVIGVSHNPNEPDEPLMNLTHPPSLAQMTSHLLNGSFIDALEEDMETLLRFNEVAQTLDEAERTRLNLNCIDVLSITPSRPFNEIAESHIASLPRSMRFLFGTLGATRRGGGGSLASYLLFEQPFLHELMECGYRDAMAKRDEIIGFLQPEHVTE